MLPIPTVTAYKALLEASPTTYPSQPLFTVMKDSRQTTVTIAMLSQVLNVLLEALHENLALVSLHSLRVIMMIYISNHLDTQGGH